MQTLQLTGPRRFSNVHLPIPPIRDDGAGKLLVKLQWALVCGSDVSKFAGANRDSQFPLLPGMPLHECVGQDITSTTEAFRPGEWVVAIPEGEQGLSEFFVALDSQAIQLPLELVDCDASPLIQPLSTVIYGIDRLGSVEGHSVTVVGLGAIGLLFCWLFKQRGAKSITGVDPCQDRCEVAVRLGADKTFPMRSADLVETIHQKARNLELPDIVVEAVGHQTETINDCLSLVQQQGTVLAFGVPDQDIYPLAFEVFFRKNAHLIAAVTPDWSKYLPLAQEIFSAHHQELKQLVTHRFPIRQSQHAFTLYENHAPGLIKALLDASAW